MLTSCACPQVALSRFSDDHGLAQFVPYRVDDMTSAQEQKGTSTESGQAEPTTGVPQPLYSSYLEHRRYLIESEQDAAKSYDRWLLTLSGGALGLSMVFARDIAVPAGTAHAWLLLAAWLSLSLAIALGLVSIYLSQTAHEEFRRVLDETLEAHAANREYAGFWSKVREKQARSWRARWVGWLNLASGAAFVTGIVFLSVFACLNVLIGSDRVMAEKPNESTERVVPVEQPAPSPKEPAPSTGERVVEVPCSDRPFNGSRPAMKPAPGPVDQVPPPQPERRAAEGE